MKRTVVLALLFGATALAVALATTTDPASAMPVAEGAVSTVASGCQHFDVFGNTAALLQQNGIAQAIRVTHSVPRAVAGNLRTTTPTAEDLTPSANSLSELAKLSLIVRRDRNPGSDCLSCTDQIVECTACLSSTPSRNLEGLPASDKTPAISVREADESGN